MFFIVHTHARTRLKKTIIMKFIPAW